MYCIHILNSLELFIFYSLNVLLILLSADILCPTVLVLVYVNLFLKAREKARYCLS